MIFRITYSCKIILYYNPRNPCLNILYKLIMMTYLCSNCCWRIFLYKIVTLSDRNSDGIIIIYRHYPKHIPSLFFLYQSGVLHLFMAYINNDFCLIYFLRLNYLFKAFMSSFFMVSTPGNPVCLKVILPSGSTTK